MKFLETSLTLDNYWRALILFGKNSAAYKFALGKSLLGLAETKKSFISYEELAGPFVTSLLERLKVADRQGTAGSSKFLEGCRKHLKGELTFDQLRELTVQYGFRNVIDAFHVVTRGREIPRFFYEVDRQGKKGLRLSDNLFSLNQLSQAVNLPHELTARWQLVETAWMVGISHNLLGVDYQEDDQSLGMMWRGKRVGLTSCRSALNGYQKGKCFYCGSPVLVTSGVDNSVDVDHFFPFAVQKRGLHQKPDLNGVWNLVLACRPCNRAEGKFNRVPTLKFLERLALRNDFFIDSHHPLRETLILQTGSTSGERTQFLQSMDSTMISYLVHRWSPSREQEAPF